MSFTSFYVGLVCYLTDSFAVGVLCLLELVGFDLVVLRLCCLCLEAC